MSDLKRALFCIYIYLLVCACLYVSLSLTRAFTHTMCECVYESVSMCECPEKSALSFYISIYGCMCHAYV